MNKKSSVRLIIIISLSCVILGVIIFFFYKNDTKDTSDDTKRGKIDAEELIESVEITMYDTDEYSCETIEINFLEKTKTTSRYKERECEEEVVDFTIDQSFESFIRENINANSSKDKKDHGDEEYASTWEFRVRGEKHFMTRDGDGDYPSFWSDLMKYVGED